MTTQNFSDHDGNRYQVDYTNFAQKVTGGDITNNVLRVEGQFNYEIINPLASSQVLGTTGAAGDLLHSVIITASTGTITILDGASTIVVIPAASTGVWLFDTVAVTAWKVTTPASTSCTCVGRFT